MATLVDEQRAIFNPDQATVFNAVLESVTNNQDHLFFIRVASGCEKTLLLFCWMEKGHLTHTSRPLLFMKG